MQNNLTDIVSESYGRYEADFSSTQAAFYDSLWQQTAALPMHYGTASFGMLRSIIKLIPQLVGISGGDASRVPLLISPSSHRSGVCISPLTFATPSNSSASGSGSGSDVLSSTIVSTPNGGPIRSVPASGSANRRAVAARFYTELSGSVSTGHAKVARALAAARTAVFNDTSDPTALAYIFYGDPNLMLGTSLPPAAYRIPTK